MNEPTILRVIEGGREPEPKLAGGFPPGEDWLRKLEYGDRFLSRGVATQRADFDQYGIAFILPEAILLAEMQPMGNHLFRWVDSQRFSGLNKFVALLPNPPQEEGDNERYLSGPADSEDHDGHEGSA